MDQQGEHLEGSLPDVYTNEHLSGVQTNPQPLANDGYNVDILSSCLNLISFQDNQTDSESFANFSCDLSEFGINVVPDPAEYDVLKYTGYKVTVIILCSVVILFGGIGNTLVVLTVVKTKAMWTATNIFIANLALADVFVCVLDLPPSTYYQLTDDWIFGETLCHLIPMLHGIVVYSSTLTLTMIAIDRYILILYPLARKITLSIAMLLLVGIVIVSIAVALPIAIYSKFTVWDDPSLKIHRIYCIEHWPTSELRKIYTVSMLFLQFLLPIIIIAILYIRIFRRIRQRMSSQSATSRRTKTTKMLVAVVTVFALTWTPFHIHSILLDFSIHPFPSRFYKFTDAVLRCLALSSSCINPLLYGWLNDNFRTAFLSLIKRPTATPTGIQREDESEMSRKTVSKAATHGRSLYEKITGFSVSTTEQQKQCCKLKSACCITNTVDSSEDMPLQSIVVDKNGHAVVLKATNQNCPNMLNSNKPDIICV